jgi:voltage-gated potassium channel
MVLLPALRPLRVLRIFTAGQALVTRGGRMSLLRSTQAIVTAAAVLILIAALAALDAERDAPGTHIRTLADSLWWAATTVTTVGYGDTYPITGTGRMVAVTLMLVGISLVGVITANGTPTDNTVPHVRPPLERQGLYPADRLCRC